MELPKAPTAAISKNDAPEKVVSKYRFTDFELYQPELHVPSPAFKKFGHFYADNLSIYQIHDYEMLEDHHEFMEIYLYFIDSTLLKIQALTTRNIATELINRYKGAKLLLSDDYNKAVASKESVVKRMDNQLSINRNLTNYKLRWENGNSFITYSVNENIQPQHMMGDPLMMPISDAPQYVLTYQCNTYDKRLYELNKSDNFKDEILTYDQD